MHGSSSSSQNPLVSGPNHDQQGTIPLHDPRLVRTAHNADGLSVFVPDETVHAFRPFGPLMTGFYNFDFRDAVPVNNSDPVAVDAHANKIPRCPPNGLSFGVSDLPANYSVPMHRTLSIDYAVVLSGEIVLRLDSGEERTVRSGEFIIQQGTNHEWVNRTNHVCRILFVMAGAEKVVLQGGRVLEEIVPKPKT